LARREEDVEVFEVDEYWEMVEEERVNVIAGLDKRGLGNTAELSWVADWGMPHPPVASVNG
jgi:hypothetical protein